MSWPLVILTFLVGWWICLFMVLPISIERGEGAAPRRIYWWRILWLTTVLAVFFTAVLALVVKSGIIPVRDIL